jgi:hypothetical protein
MFVGIGSNTNNVNTSCKKGYVSGKKCALVKKAKADKMGSIYIECTKLVTGRLENCDKTVSEDYGIFSVPSKMMMMIRIFISIDKTI